MLKPSPVWTSSSAEPTGHRTCHDGAAVSTSLTLWTQSQLNVEFTHFWPFLGVPLLLRLLHQTSGSESSSTQQLCWRTDGSISNLLRHQVFHTQIHRFPHLSAEVPLHHGKSSPQKHTMGSSKWSCRLHVVFYQSLEAHEDSVEGWQETGRGFNLRASKMMLKDSLQSKSIALKLLQMSTTPDGCSTLLQNCWSCWIPVRVSINICMSGGTSASASTETFPLHKHKEQLEADFSSVFAHSEGSPVRRSSLQHHLHTLPLPPPLDWTHVVIYKNIISCGSNFLSELKMCSWAK